MTKIANKHGAPQAFINFCKNDDYSRGDADFSVTQLIEEPRIVAFNERYPELIVIDPYESPWLFIGQMLHGVLEDHSPDNEISEERIHLTVDGVKLSGAMDVQFDEVKVQIRDYKLTSVYSLNDTTKWEQQLNLYAFLVEEKYPDKEVTDLMIHAFLRDWRIGQSEVIKGYPKTSAVNVSLPLWDAHKREAYVREKIAIHSACVPLSDDDLPECSHEARWPSGTLWELITEDENGDELITTYKTKTQATAAMGKLDPIDELTASIRKTFALYRRCKSYCNFNSVCNQYQGEQKT